MNFEVTDVAPSDIRSGNNLMEWVRANAIQRILLEAIEATHDNNHLDSLEMAVYYLHQNFSVHHSEDYLEEVKKIEDYLSGKILLPELKRRLKEVQEDAAGRKKKAKLLLDWYGLITRYLFPHEGIGEIKEGIMRRGFYEDKLLLEYEEKERKKFDARKIEYERQIKEGVPHNEVKFVE